MNSVRISKIEATLRGTSPADPAPSDNSRRIKIKTKTKMTRARMIRTMMVLPMLTKLKMATLIKMMVEILHYLKMMMIVILALLASCVVPYLPPPGTQHKTLSRFGLYQEVQRRFVDFRG